MFAKSGKATISFAMSVRLSALQSVAPNGNRSALAGRILVTFFIERCLLKSAEKIQVSLNSEKIIGILHGYVRAFIIPLVSSITIVAVDSNRQ